MRSFLLSSFQIVPSHCHPNIYTVSLIPVICHPLSLKHLHCHPVTGTIFQNQDFFLVQFQMVPSQFLSSFFQIVLSSLSPVTHCYPNIYIVTLFHVTMKLLPTVTYFPEAKFRVPFQRVPNHCHPNIYIVTLFPCHPFSSTIISSSI